ncbi:oxysterol-binding protein 1-like, partial [Mizuhopecten yessoensis]|uniref:oxysterol-binding protein 1-like n=1 Tax=Mizuhopecten yessoensis TaxID=6573 RepID=UPI000B45AF6A
SDEEEAPEPDKNELQNMLKTLASKLEDMNTCNDLISKHGSGLQRALTELETLNNTEDAGSKLKVVNERATMFRITSNAMINACSEYLESAQGQVKRLQKIVHFEQEQRMKLEEMVEQLAKDQVSLETQAKRSMHANASDNKDKGEDFNTECRAIFRYFRNWACCFENKKICLDNRNRDFVDQVLIIKYRLLMPKFQQVKA